MKIALLKVVQEEQADNGVIEPIDGKKRIYKFTQGEDLDQTFYGTTSVIWNLAPVSSSVFSLGEDIRAQPTNLPPGTTLTTKLGVGGSTVQGRVQPYPGDIDFSEQFEIEAPNSNNAAKAAANTIVEFVTRTRNNPNFEFQGLIINTLEDGLDGNNKPKRTLSFEELASGEKYNKLVAALEKLNSSNGNVNTFWRAKVDGERFIAISKILDITAKKSTTGEELFSTRQTIGKEELLLSQQITEEEDFFLTRLGGAEYQTAYIDEPEKIPAEKMGDYASLMRNSALRLADEKGKYLKAAKRAFNYFMSIGNIEAMQAVKPVFESPHARVNQEVAVMEAIGSALDARVGAVPTLILQVGEARNMLNKAAEIIENRLSAVNIATGLRNLAIGLPGNDSDLLQQNGQRSATLAGLVRQTETLINQGVRSQVESIIETYLRNYYQPNP